MAGHRTSPGALGRYPALPPLPNNCHTAAGLTGRPRLLLLLLLLPLLLLLLPLLLACPPRPCRTPSLPEHDDKEHGWITACTHMIPPARQRGRRLSAPAHASETCAANLPPLSELASGARLRVGIGQLRIQRTGQAPVRKMVLGECECGGAGV